MNNIFYAFAVLLTSHLQCFAKDSLIEMKVTDHNQVTLLSQKPNAMRLLRAGMETVKFGTVKGIGHDFFFYQAHEEHTLRGQAPVGYFFAIISLENPSHNMRIKPMNGKCSPDSIRINSSTALTLLRSSGYDLAIQTDDFVANSELRYNPRWMNERDTPIFENGASYGYTKELIYKQYIPFIFLVVDSAENRRLLNTRGNQSIFFKSIRFSGSKEDRVVYQYERKLARVPLKWVHSVPVIHSFEIVRD